MNFLIKTIKGVIIGIAAMTAGAGTFAIILGVYDRCMEIIARPFKNFKENLIYVAPIILGIVVSALVFGKGIVYLLDNYNSYVKFAFLGIIVGGIPQLFSRANKDGFNKKYIISLILAFMATLIATHFIDNFRVDDSMKGELSIVSLVIYGIVYGFGAIAPGMTTIHILMFLGVLSPIMDGILGFNFGIIIPFGIGYLSIVLITANLITYLFKKFYGYTYYGIIGFSITSLVMLIPNLTSTIEYIICPLIAIIFGLGVFKVTNIEKKLAIVKEKNI